QGSSSYVFEITAIIAFAQREPRAGGAAMSSGEPLSRRVFLRAGAATLLAAGATAAAEDRAVRIIDPHVHVWKNDPKYPWPREVKDPPKEDALPQTLLDLMKAHGVEKTVLVHVIHYRWDCRYAGDVLNAHGDRFQGVCRVDATGVRA